MLTQAMIIALIVLSIHYTFQKGEIFGSVGNWLEKKLPSYLHPPVFECNVCMSFWYGTGLYWLIWGNNANEWIIVVLVAMGFNIVFNKWEPKDQN